MGLSRKVGKARFSARILRDGYEIIDDALNKSVTVVYLPSATQPRIRREACAEVERRNRVFR